MDAVVSISPSANDAPWSVHGQWWLPETPDRRVGGVLTVDADGKFDLVLSGGLFVDPFTQGQTILGITGDNKRSTATEAYLSGGRQAGFGDEAAHTEQRWRGWTLFRGAHFPEGSKTVFRSASITTDRLSEWCPPELPSVKRKKKTTVIEVREPDPVRAETEIGRISIVWPQGESMSVQEGVRLSMHPTIVLEAKTPIDLDVLWNTFAMPMLFLLTLSTGSANYLQDMQVTAGDISDSDTFQQASVVSSKWRAGAAREEARSWEHLIPFSVVEPRFEELCVRWLNIVDQYNVPLLSFSQSSLRRACF